MSILEDKIVYDDYNSNIRADQDTIGTLTTNCGTQALRNGWKIIEEKINFVFPEPIPLEKKLKDVLEKEVDEKYYLSVERLNVIYEWEKRQKENGRGFRFEVKNGDSVGRAVTTSGDRPCSTNYVAIKTANTTGYDLAKDGDGVDLAYPDSKTRRGRVGHGVAKTLPTTDSQGVLDGYRIRKLTPKECWRLMGFDDADFEKAAQVNSNAQLYKQAGNSIVVKVLELILKELL